MRNCLSFFLIMLLSIAVSTPVHSNEFSPYERLKNLHRLQDDVATGKTDALMKQASALAAFNAQLQQTDLSVFNDARNIYALITYLFSGGDPNIAANLLQKIPESQVSHYLIKGALAYAHGRRDDFLNIFTMPTLEKKNWPEALCLSIYLSLVPDQARKDPVSASERLDYIRLTAPGSLFEEAAIHRQIMISATLNDLEKIHLLVRSYVDRFSDSPYADNFWNELAYVLPTLDNRLTDISLDKLVSMTPFRIQYLTYLYIARTELINGHMERASHAARQANRLAVKLKIDNTNARFYYAASQVSTTEALKAIKMLQTIRADDLEERNRLLLGAAKFVAKSVVDYPTAKIAVAQLVEKKSNGDNNGSPWHDMEVEKSENVFVLSDSSDKSHKIVDFLEKAQKKLNAVDQLLKEEVK
ncbi:MAG: chemotaxis protein MotC [Candidatus Tokpelaia sp. JSC188]|nr:MAG: chemotaxis protein MotC [Candidatus Tokpelaia sp. JSC188]